MGYILLPIEGVDSREENGCKCVSSVTLYSAMNCWLIECTILSFKGNWNQKIYMPVKSSELGRWLHNQRLNKTRGKLVEAREEKLNLVGRWYFTKKELHHMFFDDDFNNTICKLEAYKRELIRLVSH